MRTAKIWLISLLYYLVLQIVLVYGVSDIDEFRELTSKYRKKCISETKTTAEVVEATEYGEFPDDEKLKCYFNCVLEKYNVMDKKNGKIKYNLLKTVIPEAFKEIGHEMIDTCSSIDSNDKCEKSFMFMKCMFEVNPIAFIAP
ncbi:general odorant-binding protein 83a-like isoform X3 [Apis florea]|uniref:general odorant-binding protein 83a-like isoform X3 n=1 Tax=Apis florea TaxID=7463 RepID=UPI000252B408|nr:general odorant-binding protein 83a-like isoform X3 [Apis florea]